MCLTEEELAYDEYLMTECHRDWCVLLQSGRVKDTAEDRSKECIYGYHRLESP